MLIKCQGCKSTIAFSNEKDSESTPVPQNGAKLELRPGFAPRLRCARCHKLTIVLKGSL